MNRREFLKKSAIVTAGTAAAAAAPGVTTFARTMDLTGRLVILSPHQATTLLEMARQIYPHDQLDDSCYMPLIDALDAEAAKTPEVAKLLREGVANLDGMQSAHFVTLSADDQVADLKKIEKTPFFQKVQSTELVSLYNNHAVWKEFGYPGASYPFGGYIHHGFNDLNWLPDPPESASPKPA
jgi:hypothetical protein